MSKRDDTAYRAKVFEIVRRIPAGRVMTYGQIAIILGEGYTPRTIGYVMAGADAEDVPWQRVINTQGRCSTGKLTIPINLQQELLETEGIIFNKTGKCDLKEFRWFPDEKGDPTADDETQVKLFLGSRSE